jgi:hypothetical protein
MLMYQPAAVRQLPEADIFHIPVANPSVFS